MSVAASVEKPKLLKMLKHIMVGADPSDAVEVEGVMPSETFNVCLRKERARTDRHGHPFTMLVMEIPKPGRGARHKQAMAALARVTLRRARIMDTVGWFGNHLAVILPHTGAEHVAGIWRSIHDAFVKRILAEMPDQLPLPEVKCESYVYPSAGHSGAVREFKTAHGKRPALR